MKLAAGFLLFPSVAEWFHEGEKEGLFLMELSIYCSYCATLRSTALVEIVLNRRVE